MKNEIVAAGGSIPGNKIMSGSLVMVQSIDGNELQYDTLNATLDLGGFVPTLFKPKDADGLLTSENELFGVRPLIRVLVTDPALYKYGEEVLYRHDGKLVGKYYMSSVERVGKTSYRITCVSAIGLLANSQHYGGIYSGITFSELLAEIIGGVVRFGVAPELEDQRLYGWLPIATRRKNLHQALFAMGAAARKDQNGDLMFEPLSDETHTEIEDNRIYTNGTITYPDAVTRVSVAEHTFAAGETDETVVLFEGVVSSERITTPKGDVKQGALVVFDEPVHDLAVENGEIIEGSVNYAVLAPAADCRLTGKKYTHTIRRVTRPETEESGTEETENTINVTDATLISIANSENVANRLMSYYSSAKTVTEEIVLKEERPGDAVRLTDPFGETTKGIIKSLDVTMGNTMKARAEIVSDYSPGGAGNFYTKLEVVSEDGVWTVPDGVSRIRVAIIGGGNGGQSGASGEDGESGQEFTGGSGTGARWGAWGRGGSGGMKGTGGQGGKILVVSLVVTKGETFDVKIGAGGAGGICSDVENAEGASGEETTFGQYTSENGIRSATGYTDLFGSTSYGMPGPEGAADGSDGDSGGEESGPETAGESITIAGVTYVSGKRGETIVGSFVDSNGYTRRVVIAGGGNGGGAAAFSNGEDGGTGSYIADSKQTVGTCGAGGQGGSAGENGNDATVPGSGGQGGSGGGGGGGGASGWSSEAGTYIIGGKGGKGGRGSNGGRGADGCVLIYY